MPALLILGILGLGLAPAADSIPREGDSDRVGYDLLDRLVEMFRGMAASGTGGRQQVDENLDSFMGEARAALEKKAIDPVFFHRYRQMLSMIKLFIVEDDKGILEPLIEREGRQFVAYTTGAVLAPDEKMPIGIIADAIAHGIIDLHFYLKTREAREKMRQEWDKRFADSSKSVWIPQSKTS